MAPEKADPAGANDPAAAPRPAPGALDAAERAAAVAGLALWGVGVQVHEWPALVGLGLCVLAALSRSARRRLEWRAALGRWKWLVAFAAWAWLAPLAAGRTPTDTGFGRVFDWAAIPAAALAWELAGPRARRALGVLLGATLAAACAFSAAQYLGRMPPEEFFRPLRFTGLPFDRVYEPAPAAPGRFNAGGFQFHRLKFAHVAGLGVIAATALALGARGRRKLAPGLLAVAALLAITVFASARAAAVAAAAGAVLSALLLARSRRRALLAAGVLLAAGAALTLLAPNVRARFARTGASGDFADRKVLARAGLRAVASAPVAGLAPGRLRISDWVEPGAAEHLRRHPGEAHNQFLTLAAETGVPGLLLFLALLASLARAMPAGPGGAAGAGMLLFFAALSMLHDPLFHGVFSKALALGLGWALARAGPDGRVGDSPT